MPPRTRKQLLVLLLPLCGCVNGLIYTHITQPLDVNFTSTAVQTQKPEKAENDVKSIRYYVEINWDSNGIGDIARKHGMTELYYADFEELSVLGVWRQQWVHVYGR